MLLLLVVLVAAIARENVQCSPVWLSGVWGQKPAYVPLIPDSQVLQARGFRGWNSIFSPVGYGKFFDNLNPFTWYPADEDELAEQNAALYAVVKCLVLQGSKEPCSKLLLQAAPLFQDEVQGPQDQPATGAPVETASPSAAPTQGPEPSSSPTAQTTAQPAVQPAVIPETTTTAALAS